jgi:hypothetical protein
MRKFIVGERYKVGGDSSETGNIIEITEVDRTWCYYKNIESECTFDRFMPGSQFAKTLIPVAERKFDEEKIVITRKGNKTIANYYLNGEAIQAGLARCCPEDEFDFETGAKLAVFRMFGAMKNSAFDWNAFAAGKIKKAVTRENIDAFLKECDAHDLAWGHHKASEWNPFKTKEEIFSLSKSKVFGEIFNALLDTLFDLPETIYISVVDGVMKFSDKESTFDWEKFKNHEIAVKVTPENVMEFLQEAEKNGCHWRTGELPTEINPYEILINTEPLCLHGFPFDRSGNFGYRVIEPEDLEIVEW